MDREIQIIPADIQQQRVEKMMYALKNIPTMDPAGNYILTEEAVRKGHNFELSNDPEYYTQNQNNYELEIRAMASMTNYQIYQKIAQGMRTGFCVSFSMYLAFSVVELDNSQNWDKVFDNACSYDKYYGLYLILSKVQIDDKCISRNLFYSIVVSDYHKVDIICRFAKPNFSARLSDTDYTDCVVKYFCSEDTFHSAAVKMTKLAKEKFRVNAAKILCTIERHKPINPFSFKMN